MEQKIKMGLAAILLVILLALGGVAAGTSTLDGGLSALISTASAVAQKVEAKQMAQLSTAQQPATTSNSNSTAVQAAPAQQSGVIDARNAVRQTGSAVVTVVNNLQATGRRS